MISPSVRMIRMVCADRFASYHSVSLEHHPDFADARDAMSSSHSEPDRCPTMPGHSPGLAVRLDSSRKTSRALSFRRGLAIFSRPCSTAGAKLAVRGMAVGDKGVVRNESLR
jgi:hypothetical protein